MEACPLGTEGTKEGKTVFLIGTPIKAFCSSFWHLFLSSLALLRTSPILHTVWLPCINHKPSLICSRLLPWGWRQYVHSKCSKNLSWHQNSLPPKNKQKWLITYICVCVCAHEKLSFITFLTETFLDFVNELKRIRSSFRLK